jgi:hypothetical protein
MTDESYTLPATSIEPAAMVMALRYKIVAGIAFVIAALFLWAEIAHRLKDGFDHGVAPAVFACVVFIGMPASIGLWFFGKAKRVTNAGRIASTDASFTWHLVGGQIAATDGKGVPRPDLSFAITAGVRRTLPSIPRATAQR